LSDPRDGPATVAADRRPRHRVVVNASANVVGQAVAVLAGLVCVPIYLHLLGAEAIGLIGFSLALQAIVRMLDLGMSSAVVRQVARLAGTSARGDELVEFHATFERLFAAAAAGITALTLALAPLVAAHWLHGQQLPPRQVTVAVAAISVQAALLFMGALYQGVLMGLERQVRFNRIRVVETLASQVGAVLLLSLWTARVEVLFGWQLAVTLAALGVYRRAAARSLPEAHGRARFRFAHVRAVWIFAVGMAGITTTGTILANMDKVLLSRWLQLGSFGYYTLAFYGASLVAGLLVQPVFNALFPRACALVEGADAAGERRLYHVAIQGLVTMVWPVAAVLWVFAHPVLRVWIGDPAAVAAAAAVLPWLVAGVAFNTLMVPAYMLQLAHAWTTLGLALNLALIAVFAPLLFVLTTRWGLTGAAVNFALMQGTYLLVGLPLTHRRLLRDAFREVVLRDLLPGVALCVAGAAGLAAARNAVEASAPAARYSLIVAAWIALTAATALVSPRVRPVLRRGWPPFSGS
jgi:O-antigen/teichoic acid export membrane protein